MKPLAFVASLLAVQLAHAQYPLVRTMTAMDGQQGVQATCMAQDRQGLIWLGCERGLFRTDGDRTDPVLRTDEDPVLALCASDDGVYAALGSGAVMRCSGAGCDTLWMDSTYRTSPVRSLVFDARAGLWAGTYGNGSHLWRKGKLTLTRLGTANGLGDAHVNAQCAVGTDRMAIATDQGIAIADLDGKVLSTFGEAQGAPDNLVLDIAATADGQVWAATDRGGVFRFDPKHIEAGAVLMDSTWAGGAINRIACTEGRVWLGASGGGTVVCDRSQGLAYYRPTLTEQGAGSQVLAFIVDRDGAVWWCDGSAVLRRADPDVLLTPRHEGVDMRAITSITSGPDHRIAFATDQGVFTHASSFQEDRRLERIRFPFDQNTRAVSLCWESTGALWAGTFGNGVYRADRDGRIQRFIGEPVPINDNVLAIRSRSDTLWFATLDGLFRSVAGVTTKIPIPGSGFTFDVLPIADGAVLVATDGSGVIRVERDGTARTLPGTAPGHRTFYSLCADASGHVWACGPATGIHRVDRDRLVAIPADAGAVMNDVYALRSFGDRLFIFGDGGAFFVDPSSGRTAEVTNVLGVHGAKAELNTATIDTQGALWVASDVGLFRLSPGAARRGLGVNAAITSARMGAEDLLSMDRSVLPADHDPITFRFTGIRYDAPGDVRFAYRLLGADSTLRLTRDREITFSHLPPGSYTFEVYAFSGNRPFEAVPDTFGFTVSTPWWRQPWAILTGTVLLALIVFTAIRIRDDRLRARDRMEKTQAEMEREKVRFQMQVLRSQVNPHFLFNSFNTLIELIEETPAKAVKHVEQLSDFFREILQVRDKELIPLSEELRLVDTYFLLEQRRFGDRIALRTHVTQAALEALVPPLTVQLLVENALKHNRATDEEPLVVQIEAEAGTLTVTNPYRPREQAVKSTGFGIESIGQRFAAITHRSVVIGREKDNFVARIPLISPGHEDPDRRR